MQAKVIDVTMVEQRREVRLEMPKSRPSEDKERAAEDGLLAGDLVEVKLVKTAAAIRTEAADLIAKRQAKEEAESKRAEKK